MGKMVFSIEFESELDLQAKILRLAKLYGIEVPPEKQELISNQIVRDSNGKPVNPWSIRESSRYVH